ncbi:hypothetical protein DVH24_016897 [Malus domestica]|uniref:RRM domain-containing protein n=1 Tax=Malus domestica TaxID=3750 RepID=A0A498IUR1_MALDO|nr:hypothetical protein DVH24_016897 [Malus domestica]
MLPGRFTKCWKLHYYKVFNKHVLLLNCYTSKISGGVRRWKLIVRNLPFEVIERFCICTIHTQTGCRRCTFFIRALLWSSTKEVVDITAKESNATDEIEGDDLDRTIFISNLPSDFNKEDVKQRKRKGRGLFETNDAASYAVSAGNAASGLGISLKVLCALVKKWAQNKELNVARKEELDRRNLYVAKFISLMNLLALSIFYKLCPEWLPFGFFKILTGRSYPRGNSSGRRGFSY